MKKILHLFLLGAALASGASDGEFAPYQTIIDRMPFGRPPAVYAQAEDEDDADESDVLDETDPAYEKAVARLRASVRVCAVNVPPHGEPVVGFTDLSRKTPRHHLLAQGQTADGWTVVKIDAAARRTVLSREGVSVELALGAVVQAPGKTAKPAK